MVKVRLDIPLQNDGSVDLDNWLATYHLRSPAIKTACDLSRLTGEGHFTDFNQPCFLFALEIAELISNLKLGDDAIAASLLYPAIEYAGLQLGDITEQFSPAVISLLDNLHKLQDFNLLMRHKHFTNKQLDNIRKMLLAMVKDVRVVVIKLAERVCLMRAIHNQQGQDRTLIAQETMQVFAPLASRLGIHDLKWELEDLSFSILEADTYKSLAKKLQERRQDRERRVHNIISTLQQTLKTHDINGEVYGRAKHIYSLHRKMQRKKVDLNGIFDAIAVRILVPSIEDCYTLLGEVHQLWHPIPEEFDDYINQPKDNGYQSLHTAVIDSDGKSFEIQVRTFAMHEACEMGVAAHWLYKEGKSASDYEEKIKWLRQLLDWQKEMSPNDSVPEELEKNIFNDRIYVFTPQGEIVDLPQGATPLDFAYNIHTDLGHRCRGAKVSDKLIPLNTPLKMGDTIEILTTKESSPSRDWLLPQRGYITTSHARAKILNWFKKQDFEEHANLGKDLLEKEIKRLSLGQINWEEIAEKFHYKHATQLFASLGAGDIKLSQITQPLLHKEDAQPVTVQDLLQQARNLHKKQNDQDISISGVNDLLTHMANCCKPIPGDTIIGYITQGHGITIHHNECPNIKSLDTLHKQRLVDVDWNQTTSSAYPVDIEIQAFDRPGLVGDIAQVLSHEKISITNLITSTDKHQKSAYVLLTIELNDFTVLNRMIEQFKQIPNVIFAGRKKSHD